MTIIQLGHYQEKSSLSSEKPNIIRIIGVDPKKEGYWLTQDLKSIPEYILSEEYVFLYTSHSEQPKKQVPLNIFEGIGDLVEDQKIFSEVQPQILPANSTHITPVQPKIVEEKISFELSLINKISIDNLNKISLEKLGIEKYSKPTVNIQIPIILNYDISKLKQTIELFELNENIVLNHLVNQISIESLKPLILIKLKEFLHEPIQQLIAADKQEIPILNEQQSKLLESIINDEIISPTKIIQQNIIEDNSSIEINNGISEINDYLKNQFKNG
jgi:hypothetical protein